MQLSHRQNTFVHNYLHIEVAERLRISRPHYSSEDFIVDSWSYLHRSCLKKPLISRSEQYPVIKILSLSYHESNRRIRITVLSGIVIWQWYHESNHGKNQSGMRLYMKKQESKPRTSRPKINQRGPSYGHGQGSETYHNRHSQNISRQHVGTGFSVRRKIWYSSMIHEANGHD